MGAPKEPEREAWRSMNRRPVPVCDQWRQSYAAFKDDVGPKPHPKHVLSRRDKSAPYQPGNVAWAPKWADSFQDQDGACFVLSRMKQHFNRLKVVFADSAYNRNGLPDWVNETFGWVLQTVLRPVGVKGFAVLPKRWIVERTFAWITRCRRNARDYEKTTLSSEAFVHLTMIRIMARRLR